MKKRLMSLLLLASASAYLCAENSLADSQFLQKQRAALQRTTNKALKYAQDTLPKTKKDWSLAIISEGIAYGIMFYMGLVTLKDYYRNNPEDFIKKAKNFTNEDIIRISEEQADEKVNEAVHEVLDSTGLKEQVCIHYARGVPGPFCHGKNQIFLSPTIVTPIAAHYQLEENVGKPHNIEEVKFLTAHELSHAKNKDLLRYAIAAIAVPILTHVAVKAYDVASSKLIDLLIKKMNLDKNGQAYKILTTIKTINSKVVTNPIVRFIIAASIVSAYIRYREKSADLFAAEHKHTKGGISFMKRLEKEHNQADLFHPSPSQRVKYLKEVEKR